MFPTHVLRDRRGIALLTTMLVAFAVSAIAIAAVMMTLNANLVGKNTERAANVDAAAIAGLEEARSRLNTTPALYPTAGFTTVENNAAVKDANNAPIPKVTRSTYVGPSGIASGQYGVVGSIISEARDSFGNKVVRRLEVNQESFSKFAYFTDFETDTSNNTIVFGGGDQIRGPVHSNDLIKIYTSPSPAVTFFDQVTTARPTIQNQANAAFGKPPLLGVPRIPMPTVADLNKLDSLAQVGFTRFSGSTAGDAGEARTRIHFFTIDLGPPNGVQGFFMVYQAGTLTTVGQPEDFVSASLPTSTSAQGSYLERSPNCGDFDAGGRFMPAYYHDTTTVASHVHVAGNTNPNKIARRDFSLTQGTRSRCFLGGDSLLTIPAIATGGNATWPTNGHPDGGAWVQAPAAIQTALAALGPVITGRPDALYLFPLSRQWNTRFKGVVFVDGKVVLDGVIHGRVTVAANGNIIFGKDVTYYQGQTRDCTTGDIAGYFSGQSVIVANNTMNAPQTLNTDGSHLSTPSGTYRSYVTSTDETIHGFFLTLKTFGAEENGLGSRSDEDCLQGGTFNAGRGCLSTFGGIIQSRRGAVGLTSGAGYIKRYQYDACGATDPPPYYPTTGVFVKNRFYELDPTRFNVAAWYAANQN
jgi:type II secretory pathway pseudopilin PulG